MTDSNPTNPITMTSIPKPILVVTLLAFAGLTLVGFVVDGAPGPIVDAITFNWHATQIFVDLVLAIAVICVWIYADATKRGRNPWPWIIAAAIIGMFSPLAYLLTREPATQD